MSQKDIVLGSGKLYALAYGSSGIPADSTIEKDENLLGLIQGGAAITYTPSFYETKDDLGLVSKKVLTEEEAVLKSGVMTWNGETLAKLCSTSRVDDDTISGRRIVKIGGVGNYNGQKYLIRFVHVDKNRNLVIRITLVGSNEGSLELAFMKDKETIINAEFKAQPHDNEGTLVLYDEGPIDEEE